MTPERFEEITSDYSRLRIAIIGDFCLDRYLEIDPELAETSIETGHTVHNIVRTRCLPGGAGTVLNNLVALGVREIIPIGFRGKDAEGDDLQNALDELKGVTLDHFLATKERRTFTYCKPLLVHPDKPPEELNRLDFKNWSPTPDHIATRLALSLSTVFPVVDAVIVLNQVDLANTGVITPPVLSTLKELMHSRPELPVIGDSRTGFANWPPMTFKMNAEEWGRHAGLDVAPSRSDIKASIAAIATQTKRPLFVTLAEDGILTAAPDGTIKHTHALPPRGQIDPVGAGDCVTANLAAALGSGAHPFEAAKIASLAASKVIHQLGTTGAADLTAIEALLSS